jgi:DNA-binding response OmpR family regulator
LQTGLIETAEAVTVAQPCDGHDAGGGGRREVRMRVLVVEDDQELADFIGIGLRREQMAVDVVYDGTVGLERAAVNDYDVILLDRDLPGTHGDDVCRALIEGDRRARVLMVTAAGTVADRIDGLGRGSDDYLTKPFDFGELVARIRALARRAQPAVPPSLAVGDLVLDTATQKVTRRGRPIDLSPKELACLEILLAASGRTVSAEELLERAWDWAADPFTNTVKVTISRLRAKLGDPPLIETVPRAGYRIDGPR